MTPVLMNEIITEETLVVVYLDERRRYIAKPKKGEKFHTDKGVISWDDIIGKGFGSSFYTSKGIKYWIFAPLLEDIYLGFSRPSQVIYPKDAAYIVFYLGIREGDRVLEAGTGSGFMTSILAWFVGNSGRVYTYDVRDDMSERARKNIEMLGFGDRVQFNVGNVVDAKLDFPVNKIFLDLPDPWNVIPSVNNLLIPSGTIAVFVPTTNQIEKTTNALSEGNFVDIRAVELINREYQLKRNAVRPKNIGVLHTGYIITARKAST
ncbi:hypothetical protein HS7_06530 [Sulfolobales archaeon HS-7]|nr:hypothetical protein HS7_06530 [Sulfolobales archaeon HS-7]